MSKSIEELFNEWEEANPFYHQLREVYQAGHLQGCKDSLDLLKRAYDVIPSEEDPEDELDWPNILGLLTDIEEQIGYIEEQTKEQQ